ncbi:Flagella basal body P-ring formation protein FlgA [Pseudomonas sp. 8Z]|uniref:flagellar basal body P-ring formation chaperone FlgA n=1 Tax=Pseudomonas sp. 8Z TaxID=2653166 RepID=UPI0012F10AEA|nr:flagellar basal body P-ring formation chaperone FlgA [Pseudomonas sp. 8Z]VXC31316.1 Flagella basal body P-ring formation protein FlgA [Pseudomonas sp. 8Z]
MKLLTSSSRQLLAKSLRALPVLLALPLIGYSGSAAAAITTTDELIGAAESFLEQAVVEYLQRSEIQGRHEISINRLDPRLRLPKCDQALSVRLETPAQPIGRVTTRVRCDGSSPWTVFVPGEVRLFRDVLIMTRPMKRLSVIGASDVSLVEQDISQLNQGFLTDPSQAIGKKLTRQLASKQVIAPNYLQIAEVIRKGDQVVISARSASVNVRMPGEALSNGSPGEQIQVRNLRSQRVIRARVVGPGQVDVAM